MDKGWKSRVYRQHSCTKCMVELTWMALIGYGFTIVFLWSNFLVKYVAQIDFLLWKSRANNPFRDSAEVYNQFRIHSCWDMYIVQFCLSEIYGSGCHSLLKTFCQSPKFKHMNCHSIFYPCQVPAITSVHKRRYIVLHILWLFVDCTHMDVKAQQWLFPQFTVMFTYHQYTLACFMALDSTRLLCKIFVLVLTVSLERPQWEAIIWRP